jgi:hypothetical protein
MNLTAVRLSKNRHKPARPWLTAVIIPQVHVREKTTRLRHACLYAQVHVIKFYDQTNGSLLLRVFGVRIPALLPNETSQPTERTIHQSCLWPKVLRQQHPSPHAEKKVGLKPSELISIQALCANVSIGTVPRVVSAGRQHRLGGSRRLPSLNNNSNKANDRSRTTNQHC